MIEQAIAYFEDAIRESDEIIADCSEALQAELTEQKRHFEVALECMREQQERECVCEYCNDPYCPELDWKYGLDHILPDYKYCPMCGRDLRKAVKE